MRSTRQWVSGIQASSPLRPVWIRTGNSRCSVWKVLTTARAEPARAKVAYCLLHPSFGVEHHVASAVVDQVDRQAHPRLAAPDRRQLPTAQPGPDEVQLGLLKESHSR